MVFDVSPLTLVAPVISRTVLSILSIGCTIFVKAPVTRPVIAISDFVDVEVGWRSNYRRLFE